MLNYKIFFTITLLCSYGYAQKQSIQFEHLTVDEGLSSNTVFCFLQDSRGFLWVGTYDGLNKYDGYKFIVYKNSPEDSSSISDNMIHALCEDKYGNIWVGCGWGGGLNKFNRQTEKFTRYLPNPNNPASISSDRIKSICAEKSGNLWIGTELGGLEYLDIEKEFFHHYKHNPSDPQSINSNTIYAVYVDKNDFIWVGTNDGLNKFNKESNNFISYKNGTDPFSIGGNQIAAIFEDKLGYLWIGTREGGLNQFDPLTNKFKRYKHDQKNLNSISEDYTWAVYGDSKGLIWIGTYSQGLNLFDTKTERFTRYRKVFNDPKSLSDDAVYTILVDHTGIAWLGTWSGGINKYDSDRERIITYSHIPGNPNSLSSNAVYAIYKDKFGELWVGTETGGLNRIDEGNNKFTYYLHNPNDLTSVSSNAVFSICEDKDSYLWIGTDDAGINKFDRATNKFQRFNHDPYNPNSLGQDRTSQVFCDSYGDLWIGFNGGLDKLKRGENKFIHYKNDPADPKSVSAQLAYIFYEDKASNLWIGTHGDGLMLYNRKMDNFTFYRSEPANLSNSLSYDAVSSLCEDENGILWIGTNGAGLNRFDRTRNQFKHFNEKDGLANDVVNGILADTKGNLWISTGKGISKFNTKGESFTNYYSKDGLQGSDFNGRAYFKSLKGEMYFGGSNGLNRFHPDEITENPHVPTIVITDFQILHKPVAVGYDPNWERTILNKSISETELIELKHYDNILSFEFAALDFHSPEKNRYVYMLEGFDNHWIHTSAKVRTITYTNLDPGEYTLKVKGSNNDGIWNESGTSLKIIIHPPWWATWWSYILYGFVSIFIFAGTTRFYLNRQRLRTQLELEQEHAKKLEDVDKLKSNFYANISHEFRTPLMLILGPADKLISKVKDEDNQKQVGLIKGNANRLLTLINQLLDLSRIEAGKLKLIASKGNIAQFVKGLVMEFESLAEQRDISLKMIMEREEIVAYFDKEKLEKIIINILSNAFKFTPNGGRITVKLSEASINQVEIVFRDSGIGIPKSELTKIFDRFYQVDGLHTREHEGTGIGLALTKELVELHKGSIFVDSVEGHWTEVKIQLPLGREHFSDDEIIEADDNYKHKIDKDEGYIRQDSEAEECMNENLLDKTIVLIVEDNPDVREYISESLNEHFHIEEAANGEQGLRKAEKCIPDLIISDIMMPKMDGYEMTRKLRQDEKTSHIPIILLTSKSDKDSKLEGLGLGADDYLTKPFDTDELLARIKNLIEIRRKLQQKFGTGSVVLQKPDKAKLSSLDEQFMNRIMVVIDEHLSEEEFSIEEFGKDVGMSRSQMHRKLKALTGKSASLYLRTVRLAKAKQMLTEKKGNISEICYQVGFSSPAYFSRCFKDEFGHAPSELHN
jgi:signal transduction histidine kinase/ligand-binding sensor domain-containing protein/DNA-binding response OmpR family regulator